MKSTIRVAGLAVCCLLLACMTLNVSGRVLADDICYDRCPVIPPTSNHYMQAKRLQNDEALKAGVDVAVSDAYGIDLLFVPAGTFMMGTPDSEPERNGDEGPVHQVTITRAYYLSTYEITQEQYERVMGENPALFKGAGRPVENVTWHDAVAFCEKLSSLTGKTYRLPTEAEWEHACRAGTTTIYYWGDTMDDSYGWYLDNAGEETHPVGQKKPNPWGFYDLAGNVCEWCADWHSKTYQDTGAVEDPKGPANGELRVRRGGSWTYRPNCLRSGNRFFLNPDEKNNIVGFRIVCEL